MRETKHTRWIKNSKVNVSFFCRFFVWIFLNLALKIELLRASSCCWLEALNKKNMSSFVSLFVAGLRIFRTSYFFAKYVCGSFFCASSYILFSYYYYYFFHLSFFVLAYTHEHSPRQTESYSNKQRKMSQKSLHSFGMVLFAKTPLMYVCTHINVVISHSHTHTETAHIFTESKSNA